MTPPKRDVPRSREAPSLDDAVNQAQRLANTGRRAFIVLWPDQSITVEASYPPQRMENMLILAVSVDGKLHTIRHRRPRGNRYGIFRAARNGPLALPA